MSTAAVTDAVDAPLKKKRLSKKLVIMLAGGLLLLAAAGGGAVFWMKHKAAAQEAAAEAADGEEGAHAQTKPVKKDHKAPIFVPLETFTVNLADKEAERFAQIGVTLEIDDPKLADQIKTYMPAIRNGVLMIIAHKTSQQLLERAGKDQLAREIQAEAALAIGLELEPAMAPRAAEGGVQDEASQADNPVRKVYFSNFIIQ